MIIIYTHRFKHVYRYKYWKPMSTISGAKQDIRKIYIYRYVCIIFMGLQSTVHYTCAFPHKTLAEFDLGL